MKISNKEIKVRASITLEMSMILPVVLMVIIFIMSLGFYMSDMVCIRAVMQRKVIMAGERELTEQNIYSEINESLLITRLEDIDIIKDEKNIRIRTTVFVQIPMLNIRKKENIEVNGHIKSNKDYIVNAKVAFDIMESRCKVS